MERLPVAPPADQVLRGALPATHADGRRQEDPERRGAGRRPRRHRPDGGYCCSSEEGVADTDGLIAMQI